MMGAVIVYRVSDFKHALATCFEYTHISSPFLVQNISLKEQLVNAIDTQENVEQCNYWPINRP